MRHDPRMYLYDVARACEAIAQFTDGVPFVDLLSDPLLLPAVERQFAIVGEALARAIELDSTVADDVTGARDIIAFCRAVADRDEQLSLDRVWDAVEGRVPTLYREVSVLLADDR